MKEILSFNEVLIEYKNFLKKEGDLNFNEVLVLETIIKNKANRVSSISKVLSKDHSYITRVLKKLMEKKYILKVEKNYFISEEGKIRFLKVERETEKFSRERELNLGRKQGWKGAVPTTIIWPNLSE